MPVDTNHPEFDAMSPKLQLMRDALGGDFAVKKAGIKYLPKTPNQTDTEYEAYKMRGNFFGATPRALDAYLSMIYRKASVIEVPASLKPYLEDISMAGDTADEFAQMGSSELLSVGRAGYLMDFPTKPADEKIVTAADEDRLGMRPFASFYVGESIRMWKYGRRKNIVKLVMLRLDESGLEPSPTDEFAFVQVERHRVLKLDDAGNYFQEIHTKGAAGWAVSLPVYPKKANGQMFTDIQFVPFNPKKLSAEMMDPPMLSLAIANLSHYRVKTQLKHGAYYTALATSVLTGYTKPQDENGNDIDESFPLGSTTMLVFPDKDTKTYYHEFKGTGLASLERDLDREEREMAILGAHLMTPEKNGVEALGTAQMRTAGETSVLSSIATATSRAMTALLGMFADFHGVTEKVTYTVNKDFLPAGMTPQVFAQLLAAVQAGRMSQQTFFWNLQQGEIIPEGVTFEDEQARIEASAPMLPAPAPEPDADPAAE